MYLFLRPILRTVLTLLITRFSLDLLGEVGYGLHIYVYSIITFFLVVTNSFELSARVYLSRLNDIRSIGLFMYFLNNYSFKLLFVIIPLAELGGGYLLYTVKAFQGYSSWELFAILQIYLLTFVFITLRAPLISLLLRRENFWAYSVSNLVDVFLILLALFAFKYCAMLNPITYALIVLFANAFQFLFLYLSSFNRDSIQDSGPLKVTEFHGSFTNHFLWNVFGNIGFTCLQFFTVNIFTNYHSVDTLLSYNLAMQIYMGMTFVVSSLQTYFSTKIMKVTAKDNPSDSFLYVQRASLINLLLVIFPATIIILFSNEFLSIWLIRIPSYTIVFTWLLILLSVFDAASGPLNSMLMSNQLIKKYQSFLLVLSISEIVIVTIIVYLKINIISVLLIRLFFRGCFNWAVGLYIVKGIFHVSLTGYFKLVLVNFMKFFILLLITIFLQQFLRLTLSEKLLLCVFTLLSYALLVKSLIYKGKLSL